MTCGLGSSRICPTGHRNAVAGGVPGPTPENPKIRDPLCFYNERVDLVVDGEPLERPVSPFS